MQGTASIWTDDLLWENPSIHSGLAWLAQGHNRNGTNLNGDTSAIEGALQESGTNSTWKGHLTPSPKPPTATLEQGTHWQPFLYRNTPTVGHQEPSLGTNLLWEALLRWPEVLVPLLERKWCLCLYPAAFMSAVSMKQTPQPGSTTHGWDWPWSALCLWQAQKKTQNLNVLTAQTHETCEAEHPATTDIKTVSYWNMKT